jgi:hypothetical protein
MGRKPKGGGPIHLCPENLAFPERDRLPSGNGGTQSNGSRRWRCPVCRKKWGEGQVGAQPKGDRAMTGAERQRKYSDRKKNS